MIWELSHEHKLVLLIDIAGIPRSTYYYYSKQFKADKPNKYAEVEREIRRGNTYDGIIMDPPSYGRGPKGEIWKIEESIYPFIELTTKLLSDDALFFLINSYTTGLQPAVLSYMINTTVVKKLGGHVEASEIGLPVSSNGLILPCGASGRWMHSN